MKKLDSKKLTIIISLSLAVIFLCVGLIFASLVSKDKISNDHLIDNDDYYDNNPNNNSDYSNNDWGNNWEDGWVSDEQNYDDYDGIEIVEGEEIRPWYALGESSERRENKSGTITSENSKKLSSRIMNKILKESVQNTINGGNKDNNKNDENLWDNNNNNSGNDSPSDDDEYEENLGPNEIEFNVNTQFKNSDGSIVSSNNKLDVEKLVGNNVPILAVGNKKAQLFNELNNLKDKIVIVLDTKDSIEDYIEYIVYEYPNKLLIDNMQYSKLDENNSNYYLLEIKYLVTMEQMSELKKYAKDVANELHSLSDKDKIQRLNIKITLLGTYDRNKPNIYSPYTLYKNGYGVCQAYTSLGKIMLDSMGIENGIATGTLNGEPHTWNVVKLGNQVLHVDFTANHTTTSEDYLLVPRSEIIKTHFIEEIIM